MNREGKKGVGYGCGKVRKTLDESREEVNDAIFPLVFLSIAATPWFKKCLANPWRPKKCHSINCLLMFMGNAGKLPLIYIPIKENVV